MQQGVAAPAQAGHPSAVHAPDDVEAGMQVPPLQILPTAVQSWQSDPKVPHALSLCPPWQTPLMQHPRAQLTPPPDDPGHRLAPLLPPDPALLPPDAPLLPSDPPLDSALPIAPLLLVLPGRPPLPPCDPLEPLLAPHGASAASAAPSTAAPSASPEAPLTLPPHPATVRWPTTTKAWIASPLRSMATFIGCSLSV